MPNFGSVKGDIIKFGDGVEMHPKMMYRNGVLVEVRRSFRGPGGTSVTHTNVHRSWTQPVHSHRSTVEATTVLAGRVLGISFVVPSNPKIVYYKVSDIIKDELGVPHTLYATEGTQLSTSKFLSEKTEGSADWHGHPEYDDFIASWGIDKMLHQAGITPDQFYS